MSDTEHREGPSWRIVGKFSTFAKADEKRNELLLEEDLQVKVHWMSPANNSYFAVKTRLDPAKAPPQRKTKKKKGRKR